MLVEDVSVIPVSFSAETNSRFEVRAASALVMLGLDYISIGSARGLDEVDNSRRF